MLMDPNVCRVDQDVFKIRIIGQGTENPLPDAFLRPAPEACVHTVPFTEVVRQVTPGRTGSRDPAVLSSPVASVAGCYAKFSMCRETVQP